MRKKPPALLLFVCFGLVAAGLFPTETKALSNPELLDRLISFKEIVDYRLSPDGNRVAFIQNEFTPAEHAKPSQKRKGAKKPKVKSLWVYERSSQTSAQLLEFSNGVPEQFFFSADGSRLFYLLNDSLFSLSVPTLNTPPPVTTPEKVLAGPVRSVRIVKEGNRLYFALQTNHGWQLAALDISPPSQTSLSSPAPTVLTRISGGVGTPAVSADKQWAAVRSLKKATFDHLLLIHLSTTAGETLSPVSESESIDTTHWKKTDLSWNKEGSHLAYTRTSPSGAQREIVLYDRIAKKSEPILTETSKLSIITSDNQLAWDTQGNTLYFTSEKEGFQKLYAYDRRTDTLTTLLPERDPVSQKERTYEIQWFVPLRDGSLLFTANRDAPMEWRLYQFTPPYVPGVDPRMTLINRFPLPSGSVDTPMLSNDEKTTLLSHSGPLHATELFIIDRTKNNFPTTHDITQITKETDPFAPLLVAIPEQVTVTAFDAIPLYAQIIKPKTFTPTKQYPVLIWLHGGPHRQMTFGWSRTWSYAMYYSILQYLVNTQNAVVVIVDFRGSVGYGLKFKEDLRYRIGLTDVLDVEAIKQSITQLPYVDSNRIGLIGLSYGGYLALKALDMYPKEFKLGVSIGGVNDWSRILGPGSHPIFFELFGGMAKENSFSYKLAQVYPKRIEAPVLLVHGTEDRSVPFSQSSRLSAALTARKKQHTFLSVENEDHIFKRKKNWITLTEAIEHFLRTHL